MSGLTISNHQESVSLIARIVYLRDKCGPISSACPAYLKSGMDGNSVLRVSVSVSAIQVLSYFDKNSLLSLSVCTVDLIKMVDHNVVQSSNKALVSKQAVTAVFVGGTSGIGENAVRALASTHGASGRGLRAYIVGRNEKAANIIIADCIKKCPSGDFKFVRANDLASLRDVDRVCEEITKTEEGFAAAKVACIDLLVLTQAHFAFGGELEHKGIESSTSLFISL